MTEKLYYIDSHMRDFGARVLECRELEKGWAIILDRSAFFPEGGGQLADTGIIGSVRVRDVQLEGETIVHFTDRPLPAGDTVICRIDWEQRLRRMQSHSGEHIVSGLVHKHFGFDNVGFHMGESMTIDFSGELDWQQLMRVEQLANEAVREDMPVRCYFPDERELKSIEYRSKLELTEDVRLVEIGDIDICACCAPHVERTGEIGIIKIQDFMRHRGGVRVSLVCGMDALEDYRRKQESAAAISASLSVKRDEIAPAVRKILDEQQRQKERIAELSMALAAEKAAHVEETEGNICVFDNVLDEVATRELVNLLVPKCGGIAAVFHGDDENGYRYVVGSRSVNLRSAGKEINAGIKGKGGGSPEMIQGRAEEKASVIKGFVNTLHI